MSLVDGESSATSCGAKYQIYYDCVEAACLGGCSTYDEYRMCTDRAGATVCLPFYEAAVCHLKPVYSVCTSYFTFEEYFFAIAKRFCGAISEAGVVDGAPETGTGGFADDGSVDDSGGR